MNKRWLLALSVFFFQSIACNSAHTLEEKRIENVVRVFWHEKTAYSVHIQKPGSKELEVISLPDNMCLKAGSTHLIKPQLIKDVEANKQRWVRYLKNPYDVRSGSYCLEALEIHIYSEKDIEGGEWDHGKFGKGQTQVIQ